MKGAWVTLVPMSAAAALLVWGGERLSRKVVEHREPADRTRLLDFSAALRGELDRLDDLFDGHMREAGRLADLDRREALAAACARLEGVVRCQVFEPGGKRYKVDGGTRPEGGPRPPDIALAGGGGVLNPDRTLLLKKDLGADGTSSGWLATPDPAYRAHWQRTGSGKLVVHLIDVRKLGSVLRAHLAEWMKGPAAPLMEAGTLFTLSGEGGAQPAAPDRQMAGPAALVIPHRIGLGEWQISAWDRKQLAHGRDMAVMWTAGALAMLLMAAGGILYMERRRSIRLAEDRVSFVNRVSHELGTPLTNILLNLDLATRAMDSRPEEAKRRLAIVGEEVRRMSRLVANVLTFSRRERNALEVRRVSCVPDEVIAGVLEQFAPSLERRGIRIEWRSDAGAPVLMDPDALSQIVGNLISNVEKYAGSGGWLGLDTRVEKERLRVRVADRGPGIPVRHEERVFGAFERIKTSVNEGASGTGLGLSIARDLARRVDGELSFIRAATGAVFEVNLPAPTP